MDSFVNTVSAVIATVFLNESYEMLQPLRIFQDYGTDGSP